ncbi:hypothetical protein [Novosphingobium resinovorum]|uniref:Uncharacterized protein n=1 Tax=Novosphingobium resinovorum TaxID=158500 RepID=A0A1D8A305_9SPHN|nr:hypothetical protein [Novosphingobium resinovorum]AOR76533.1 hypothetical protein BES08_07085 [Novosphingobium resinovorum]
MSEVNLVVGRAAFGGDIRDPHAARLRDHRETTLATLEKRVARKRRDRFAIAALSVIPVIGRQPVDVAKDAFDIADAMLAESEKRA